MKIIGIIPAYNEEASIAEVIQGTKKYVDEVVVVDDGSTDSTAETANQAGAFVHSHVSNKGLVSTILDGYRIALEKGADIIVQIDADGQYRASEIPLLLEPIKKREAEMVLGSRFMGKIEEMPFIKRNGNRMFSRLLGLMAGMRISDGQTGFRALTRELVQTVVLGSTYTYTQEMIIRASMERFAIKEVPIHFDKRQHGKSRLISNVFTYAVNSALIIIRTIREYHSLMFFGLIGILFILLGVVAGIPLLLLFMETGQIGSRFGLVVFSGVSILFGFIMVSIGLLADMMQTKYLQIREHLRRLEDR